MASRGDTGKASSAAANKAGSGDHHGVRLAIRGRFRLRRENQKGKYLEVRGNDGGYKSSGAAYKSSRVKDEEGRCEASGVSENPWGSRQGVRGGVELPQGTNTLGVAEQPWGDETLGEKTAGEGEPGEDIWGRGGDKTSPTTRATGAQVAGSGAD